MSKDYYHETLHATAAETTSGNSEPFAVRGSKVAIAVDVTAASGTTPTLDFEVEWSPDGTNWVSADTTADTMAQITTAAGAAKAFDAKAPFARLKWTIGGTTPSFTFEAAALVA